MRFLPLTVTLWTFLVEVDIVEKCFIAYSWIAIREILQYSNLSCLPSMIFVHVICQRDNGEFQFLKYRPVTAFYCFFDGFESFIYW